MGHAKIPRQSTVVDMTAMCDVAFLLLTFFILATKQKPQDVLTVTPPNSVSAKAAPDKSILITLTKDGKTFLALGDDVKKKEILEDLNKTQNLGLSSAEIAKWGKQDFVGVPFNQIKGYLNMATPPSAGDLPGIPTDSSNNQMIGWIKSITNAYAGEDAKELREKLLIKGDNDALYPGFKAIKQAFKENDLFKFRIVTNGVAVPVGSELYKNSKAGAEAPAE